MNIISSIEVKKSITSNLIENRLQKYKVNNTDLANNIEKLKDGQRYLKYIGK